MLSGLVAGSFFQGSTAKWSCNWDIHSTPTEKALLDRRCVRGTLLQHLWNLQEGTLSLWNFSFLSFTIHYVKQCLIMKVLNVKLLSSEYICNVLFCIYKISQFLMENCVKYINEDFSLGQYSVKLGQLSLETLNSMFLQGELFLNKVHAFLQNIIYSFAM